MRGLALFVAGILIGGLGVSGLGFHALAQSQYHPTTELSGSITSRSAFPISTRRSTTTPRRWDSPEAFRAKNAQGEVQLVYVQISQNTFIELLPANAQRPPGINHFGLHVEGMPAVTAMFKARGANVLETRTSPTKAILSNVVDPNGVRMELAELPPELFHRQAMERWH